MLKLGYWVRLAIRFELVVAIRFELPVVGRRFELLVIIVKQPMLLPANLLIVVLVELLVLVVLVELEVPVELAELQVLAVLVVPVEPLLTVMLQFEHQPVVQQDLLHPIPITLELLPIWLLLASMMLTEQLV